MQKKAVFLDRDGTLIVDKIYLNDPEAIEYLPGVFSALKKLGDAGFIFLVVTNQSGVPRGLVSLDNLNEIHRRMHKRFAKEGVELAQFYYAPYMTDTDHPLRKPNAGMLFAGADDFKIDLKQSWMIGDRMTDVESGHRAGCRSVLLTDQVQPEESIYSPPEICCASLFEAAECILKWPH